MGMWRERIGIRNPEGERFEPPEAHHLDCFQDNEGFAGFEIAPMVPLPNGRKTVGVPPWHLIQRSALTTEPAATDGCCSLGYPPARKARNPPDDGVRQPSFHCLQSRR